MKRQKSSMPRVVEVAISKVATPSVNAERTMMRLRPMRSAICPTTGAATATPMVDAVIIRLIMTLLAWKTAVSIGRIGWGA